MKLGKSKEDYLKAILILQKKLGNVHSVNVAEYLGFSKASVCVAVKQLKKSSYLTMDGAGNLQLTSKGKLLAEQIYERYNLLTNLFLRIGVSDEIARKDACLIEHDISYESYEKLKIAFA